MAEIPHILIVDDSDLVSGVLSQYFRKYDFQVSRAKNGLEGIIQVYKKIPDLVIMDVEMPTLQGYQASRLLKSRRGVRDIPIIMHTTLSEDRDKFWALTSGADAFVNKNFDNLEHLYSKVNQLVDTAQINREVIQEDAGKIDSRAVLEMLGNLFDQQLFQSTILNQLAKVEKYIGSLSLTSIRVLNLLLNVCETHISTIIIKYNKQVLTFTLPCDQAYEPDVQDFLAISMHDFSEKVPDANLSSVKDVVFGIENREDYSKINLSQKKISSYQCFELKGKGDSPIGTLHLGNFMNNYFSDLIVQNIDVFARGAGSIVENAILFNTITAMENRIRNVFAKFVPPEIIKDLIEQNDDSSLQVGESRNLAILFSDIRDFTKISENNNAEEVVTFLNDYFHIMGEVIKKHGGTIDKFIGDAILAIFGAPRSWENNAERAVQAASEMIESLNIVKTGKLKLPENGLRIGVGIHEGKAIVGNIGSKDKFDYTVVGDNVNLASRLEGLTKYYRQSIIISETVKHQAEEAIQLREVDTVKVKGKEESTKIYTTIEGQPLAKDKENLNNYQKALSMYKLKNWNTAIEYFQNISEKFPDDYISEMYIKRCKYFIKNPPPEDWDGAMEMEIK
ncbi:MAG: adenylate/guanylate cyclase domain-containing protein [Spirochaetia bacterium]